MWEKRTQIYDPKIPLTCRVDFIEMRGYDSPDKWYEARRGRKYLGAFPTRAAAIEACLQSPVPPPKRAKTFWDRLKGPSDF